MDLMASYKQEPKDKDLKELLKSARVEDEEDTNEEDMTHRKVQHSTLTDYDSVLCFFRYWICLYCDI